MSGVGAKILGGSEGKTHLPATFHHLQLPCFVEAAKPVCIVSANPGILELLRSSSFSIKLKSHQLKE